MKDLNDIRVLVVGDIMIDKYIVGTVERISPEAPVPVVDVTNEYETLGGCGNVVNNLRSIGVSVDCLASVANDNDGKIIKNKLKNINVGDYIFFGSEITTVKTRIVAGEKQTQLLRYDKERVDKIFCQKHNFPILNYDVVLVSDYAKGMITENVMRYLTTFNSSIIIVDPKPKNLNLYKNVYAITPNEKEYKEMKDSININEYRIPFILETKGKKGMTLHNISNSTSEDIYGEEVEIYNVSGAGDTVLAVMGICCAMKLDILDSIKIANKCAGYVVTQPGTTPVPKDIFINELAIYINI